MKINIQTGSEAEKTYAPDNAECPRVGELICVRDNDVYEVTKVLHDYVSDVVWVKTKPTA